MNTAPRPSPLQRGLSLLSLPFFFKFYILYLKFSAAPPPSRTLQKKNLPFAFATKQVASSLLLLLFARGVFSLKKTPAILALYDDFDYCVATMARPTTALCSASARASLEIHCCPLWFGCFLTGFRITPARTINN